VHGKEIHEIAGDPDSRLDCSDSRSRFLRPRGPNNRMVVAIMLAVAALEPFILADARIGTALKWAGVAYLLWLTDHW
jgi:hypothetical protein